MVLIARSKDVEDSDAHTSLPPPLGFLQAGLELTKAILYPASIHPACLRPLSCPGLSSSRWVLAATSSSEGIATRRLM